LVYCLMKDDESLVLSSNLKELPVQVVEHRCYTVYTVKILSTCIPMPLKVILWAVVLYIQVKIICTIH
jgi:hypothetical protein